VGVEGLSSFLLFYLKMKAKTKWKIIFLILVSIISYYLYGIFGLMIVVILILSFYLYKKKKDYSRKKLSKSERTIVLRRQYGTCATCPNKYPLEEHHKISVSNGGLTDIKNVVLLCPNCHSAITKVQRSNN